MRVLTMATFKSHRGVWVLTLADSLGQVVAPRGPLRFAAGLLIWVLTLLAPRRTMPW
jgi:hypothetical protein